MRPTRAVRGAPALVEFGSNRIEARTKPCGGGRARGWLQPLQAPLIHVDSEGGEPIGQGGVRIEMVGLALARLRQQRRVQGFPEHCLDGLLPHCRTARDRLGVF